MKAGHGRDAVVAAVSTLVPESVTIAPRGAGGWKITFRRARCERSGLTNIESRRVVRESGPAEFATRLISDVSSLLRGSDTVWPGLSSPTAACRLAESEAGLQIIISDEDGHHASSKHIRLWTPSQRHIRDRARRDLDRLGDPEVDPAGDVLLAGLDWVARGRRRGQFGAVLAIGDPGSTPGS
jgi:hypothetical protein